MHDSKCEMAPGGEYFGVMIGGDDYKPPMPIPCHCAARAAGRAQAERDLAEEARTGEAAERELAEEA